MGFVGQAALHLATLARVQQRAGDSGGAATTYERAILDAMAGGDGRLAATARLNLARLLRSAEETSAVSLLEENQRWYAAAGGGDGALLNRCVLYAATADASSLRDVLAEATTTGNDEVRVYALDALARLAAPDEPEHARRLLTEADALAPALAHLVDEDDRFDRATAVGLLGPSL